MPEKLMTIIGSLPFIIMTVDEKGHKFIQLNKVRILEAVLISCITGVIAGSLVGWRDLSSLKGSVEDIRNMQLQMRNETREELKSINDRMWQIAQEKRK